MEKILLVDDDQSARVTLSIALKSEGFAVEIVDSGAEALRRVRDGGYTWVISDVNMPGMNGIELVQQIQEFKPGIRIILISAYRSRDDLQGLKVQGFLEKPIDIQKLYHILRYEHVPPEDTFDPWLPHIPERPWPANLPERERQDVIRFHDPLERQAFEKRTFDLYELLEKKVEERTGELLEKQKNLEDAFFELRKTKLYLENLIDASPECVISMDTEQRILSFNATAESTYGCGRGEMIGKKIRSLRPGKGKERDREIYETTLQEGRWTGEIQGMRKNGEIFPLSMVTTRVLDESGNVVAILELSRDITEEKKMEEQLLYAEKLGVLGQLAPKIAHEINNPLHVISANLQLGQMVLTDRDKVETCLTRALEETGRIERLTRQLMDVARPTELDVCELSITDVLENAILFLRDVGEIKRLDVRKDFSDNLPPIRGDQAQLEQVFRNLIHNASQAMEDTQEKVLSVASRYVPERGCVEIVLSDTGCGIAEEHRERIFEPFFTTKEKGKGNGLGMPIVKGIVQRHGGHLELRSAVGAGTEVRVSLPVDSGKK